MFNFRHIGIVVKNLEESFKFYNKYFDFELQLEMTEGGEYLEHLWNKKNFKIKTLKLSDSSKNICLELIEILSKNESIHYQDQLEIYSYGITHFALTVNNIDKLYSKMQNDNIEFLNNPKLSLDKKAKVAFCRDPNGCFIELVEVFS